MGGDGLRPTGYIGAIRGGFKQFLKSGDFGPKEDERMFLSVAQAKSFPRSSPFSGLKDGPGTVLLVEDEPAIARMLTRLFIQAGLRVIAAVNIAEGMSVLEQNPRGIALAFVDCHGAAREDREFWRRARFLRPGLPLLLAGGQEEPAASEPTADDGLTMFVPRPYLPTELVWKVRSILGRAKR